MFPYQLQLQLQQHPADEHYHYSIVDLEPQRQPIIHAPIPLSAQIPLLQEPLNDHNLYTPNPPANLRSMYHIPSETQTHTASYYPPLQNTFELPRHVTGRHTFPTPSELLTDMANSPESLSSTSSVDSWGSNTSASKTRRRVVAESIGFDSTDPDTITSHDKKRHYLECIESYINFLNGYFQSLGIPVPPLTRFEHQKELDNRSIRTLLVHWSHKADELCISKEKEEKRWLQLKEAVDNREAEFSCDH